MVTLALDVDGVIIEGFPRYRWDRTIREDLGINPKHLKKHFFGPLFPDVLRGLVKVEDALSRFLGQVESNVSVAEFLDYWHGKDANIREDVVAAAIDWKSRTGGQLALATNQDPTRADYLLDNLGLGGHVDVMIVSCRVGALKPEPAFFKKGDELLNRQAGETVIFLDDLIDNVSAAIEHGWLAHHVPEPEDAVSIIESVRS